MYIREMYQSADYESITVADSAIGFTATKIDPINGGQVIGAVCTVETAQIRFRTDGTNPTSSEGHLLEIGDSLTVWGADIPQFKAIRTGSTSGVLKVTYLQV